MKFGKLALAAAAPALALAPVASQAVAADRAAAPVTSEDQMGGSATMIAVIFGLAALVVFVLGTDNNDEPASP